LPISTIAGADVNGGSRGPSPGAKPRVSRRLLPIVILALPVAVQGILIGIRFADWWPVWAWYPDPGYQYLFAAGSIITGGSTDLIYHPGTSFQWLIGLSQVFTHLVAGQDTFMLDIAARPEFYAQTAGLTLAALYVIVLAAAAWRLYRSFGLWPALLFQLLLLWGLPLLAAGRFLLWPESLVLTCAVASLAILAPQLAGQEPIHPRVQAVGIGLFAAVGMTAKVTYAPVVLVALILVGWRRVAWVLLPMMAGALIMMIPVYSRLDSMQGWFVRITTNPGRHGQTGSWDPVGEFLDSMLMLNLVVRWFIPVSALIMIIAVLSFLFPRRARLAEALPFIAVALGVMVVLASGMKDSESRDFILAVPLLAALAALALGRILRNRQGFQRRAVVAATLAVSVYLAAHGVVHEENFARGYAPRLEEILRDAKEVDKLNETSRWAPAYNAWTPDSSKLFGLIWSAGSFNREVREVNPDALHFDLFARSILHVSDDNRLIPLTCQELQDLERQGGIGVIVESQGHIALNSDSSRILLNSASARNTVPKQVGRYFAYALNDVQCGPLQTDR
jgi:hypothetical protein